MDGLLQAFAVRAAGFATVTLSEVAPALQLLYVVMMYIVRRTFSSNLHTS